MIKNLLIVFVGGGFGSVCRYLLHQSITKIATITFPIGTLVVNIIGSFIIGAVFSLSFKGLVNDDLRLLLAVGFCGGFTTFSSFSFESLQLLRNGDTLYFFTYLLLSVLLCITFVYLGDYLITCFKN